MNSIQLSLAITTLKTEFSPWFIPLCLFLGVLYSALLYKKESPWSKKVNWLLASARFLTVSFLAFLIVGPLLNQLSFEEEAPIAVIVMDNSASIAANNDSTDLLRQLETLQQGMSKNGLNVQLRDLTSYLNSAEDLRFDAQSTDLNRVLQDISKDFDQQNLAATVLLSDGINNYGTSPQFFTSTQAIYTVGLGDTIPAKDLSIKRVNANKVVYQGKRFPLVVDLYNNGFVNQSLTVEIISGGKVIEKKAYRPTGDQQINSVEFLLDAGEVGIRSYQVKLMPQADESTYVNNTRTLFVEVIDSEQKILIAAAAPHPDIKALRSIIEAKEGTEVSVWLQSVTQDFPEGPFDLVIYHELPGFNALPEAIDHWIDDSNTFFITGTQELDNINQRNPVLNYRNLGQTDQVSANYSPSFDLFNIEENLLSRLNEYPPLTVPYGSFELKNNAIVLLYQRIGNAQTNRPLLSVLNDGERKSAVFSGSGFWKWRLQENALYTNSALFDELFGKLIQFLATTENKTNFEVNSIKERFTNSEAIEFVTNVYNELYEPVYDYTISLKLRNEQNEVEEYNYVNTPINEFTIRGLKPGVYSYEASTRLNGQLEISRGSFTVEQLALEDIDLTADHQLLRNIAQNSGGTFYQLAQLEQLISDVNELNPKPITRSSQRLDPLINNPLWLFILALLLSFEWFTRKYQGHY